MRIERLAYVLHIFPKISETFIAGELAELRRRGVELRILSLLPPRAEVQHDIIRLAGLDQFTTCDIGTFEAVIRKFRPQLLHAHFATEAAAKARELSASCGVPFTFTAHGYDIHRKPPPGFRARAMAARAVVTVSEANAEHITQTFGVPRSHLRVVPCGVDTERFCPVSDRSRRGDEADGVIGSVNPPPHVGGCIVCVARQVKVKNLGLLLEACAELKQRGVEFRCAMIGDGPLQGELQAKRNGLGLDRVVEMPGALEQGEVLKWWQRAAAGTLTSDNEGMPVSLMEAAACGVPVVATRVGGIPELVVDGKTGLLVPPGDARALADAFERLLTDAALRKKFGAAARRRAVKRFSVAHQVDRLLELWSEILSVSPAPGSAAAANDAAPKPRKITVNDPFNAAADAAMPTLAAALDPERAAAEFKRNFPRLTGEDRILKLKAIRVVRHKPGKRCLIEYDSRVTAGRLKVGKLILLGKVRARRSGNEGFRQQEMIWNAGFDAGSADGICVPEPIGVVSALKMWCQRKVPGEVATRLLAGRNSLALARRIAEAIHKLHRANLPTNKTHTMADELRILRECFEKLSTQRSGLAARVKRLRAACERLGAGVAAPRACGIHRDFYPAQVIVDGARLWLIDFDLFCLGDPGLDAGNFLGHVIEQALREHGDPDALGEVARALEERFIELSGERVRAAVRAYTTLTLARLVYLSTQFPERTQMTEALLSLCERRLR